MPWPITGATNYHLHLGLRDKGRAIKGMVVYWAKERRFTPQL